ncbi:MULTISPECIES: tetratricopeptide repeat protein [unclassified Paenibacillus]|uniref:tetratricopeptide repeat protein n=1 Tax=unclassified Paenibacillus TaxID=185978 RepID=UPI002405EBA6|nr:MULTISPECIES: tetratricopeptide repeat protein [unclassified Paenibacillus]MDF9842195.1 tetratricopeptide (TPR) repeat protein [Paenibacillus sp. PastF-2]MDF9848928.1 tetratricopeptide (TPR) repeat protein [Paenibacillus sp. PastM-2]MDF9855498.1 tetratricopeptide (TPR) repeat protein [Paenibacillus sp. PastF-1]MDH6480626.1 tetratricopeptide (TPR) repeat protein [Paenibacillus sp. PastH-2]MDH6508192.1 tetratricopeptide (TPR) repeat protein [Paenibacillus sp. PastM-3]
MDTRMQDAIALREAGRAEEARVLLLDLLSANSKDAGADNDAELLYQLAWTLDVLGLEREAVPYYEQSLAMGLPAEQRAGALLGLGSTYRTLGEYQRAKTVLQQGAEEYPERAEFQAFLAMALYNLGEHGEGTGMLLRLLADTSESPGIREYRKAISFYADKLDKIWP